MLLHDDVVNVALVYNAFRTLVLTQVFRQQEGAVNLDLGVVQLRLQMALLVDQVIIKLRRAHLAIGRWHIEITHL